LGGGGVLKLRGEIVLCVTYSRSKI